MAELLSTPEPTAAVPALPPASPPLDVPPLEYVQARPGFALVNLHELWRGRGLLWILAVRDLKVRYRQTLVGVAWAVLQPLTTMTLFLVFFRLLGRQPTTGDVPYALVVLSGLLAWQLFATTLTQATGSLVGNQALIAKVYFPRLILPLATVIPALVDCGIGLVLLAGFLVGFGVLPAWPVLLLPAFILLAVLTALALGIWLAALNAMYRDFGYIVPFLLQVGFFLSPVIYETAALIPAPWRPLYALNPMVGVIEGVRWTLLGKDGPPVLSLLPSLVVMVCILLTGLAYFRRVERFVADRI